MSLVGEESIDYFYDFLVFGGFGVFFLILFYYFTTYVLYFDTNTWGVVYQSQPTTHRTHSSMMFRLPDHVKSRL